MGKESDVSEMECRWFMIESNNPGRGHIEVRDPQRQTLAARLEVNVKRKRTLKISFHFVQDKAGDKTTRPPGIGDSLIDELNSIYELTLRDKDERGVESPV